MDILSLKNILLKTESPVLERSELSGKRFYEKITSIRAASFSQSLLYFEPLSRIRIPKG